MAPAGKEMRIVIFGPPGAGKGTLAQILSSSLGTPHLDMGELLRTEVKSGTRIGREVESYLREGKLVPDELVMEVLRGRLGGSASGYILDGFPRNLKQAHMLEEIAPPELVVSLSVSEETAIRRLSTRRTCRKCGAIYNLLTSPPKREGICDLCGGELYQREDDKPEVIAHRFRVYEEQTRPLLDYYRSRGILVEFDGEEEKEKIASQLLQARKLK